MTRKAKTHPPTSRRWCLQCVVCKNLRIDADKRKLADDAARDGWKLIDYWPRLVTKPVKRTICPHCLELNPTATQFGIWEAAPMENAQ